MMYKTCPHCSLRLIPYEDKYCSECQEEVDKQKKDKYKKYKSLRIDKDIQKIYTGKLWIKTRELVKAKQMGLCLYSYFVLNKIAYAEVYHHIIPIKQDINKAYDGNNIIGLTKSVHQNIHIEYDKGNQNEKEMQDLLFSLVSKWNKEFNC